MPSGKYTRSAETKLKMSNRMQGVQVALRPLNEIKLEAIHVRIKTKYGKPKYCEHCKRTDKKIYEWSNKDHQYKLGKEWWQRLCRDCHAKYDKAMRNLTLEKK
jgi:predicted Fe-S protein YdhL (DUF1289 family)